MKRIVSLLICIALCFALMACEAPPPRGYVPVDEAELYEIPTDMTADEALAFAKENDYVVFEGLHLTAGGDVWDAFYERDMSGERAAVKLVNYYTLDPDRVSEELYEKEKDNYPVI